jgi:hypothetical protein
MRSEAMMSDKSAHEATHPKAGEEKVVAPSGGAAPVHRGCIYFWETDRYGLLPDHTQREKSGLHLVRVYTGTHERTLSDTDTSSDDETAVALEEAAMSVEIDEILTQLGQGIPKLQQEMDELLVRLRRPVTP